MKLKNNYTLRTVADKTVAIALEDNGNQTDGIITLNDTGAFIFGLINDGLEKGKIVNEFYEEYDVTKEEAQKAVDAFIENLNKSGLLED